MSVAANDISGLYVSERHRLRKLVNRFINDTSAAEDIVHQTFINIIDTKDRRTLRNISAYLTRAARNLTLNHLRDLKRRGEVVLPEAALHGLPDVLPTPEETVLARSELRRVLSAIAALPARRRETFILSRFEGMSHDAIAARQGVSRNTVITQIVLALSDLDRRIGPR